MQNPVQNATYKRFLSALLPILFMLSAVNGASAQKSKKLKAWDIEYDLIMQQKGDNKLSTEEQGYLELAKQLTTGGGNGPMLRVLVTENMIRVAEKGLLSNKLILADKRDSVYYLLDTEAQTAMALPAGLPKLETRLVGDSLVILSSDDFIFEYTSEEKKIAGYPCKKAIMKNPDATGKNTHIEIWYTEKLPKTYWGEYGYLEKVPGAALAVLADAGGYTMGIQAVQVKKKKAAIAEFVVPDDYTLGTSPGFAAADSVYEYIGPYVGGLAAVSREYKQGYINESREEVIPLIYDAVNDFTNGVAVVSRDGKYGIINTKGEEITPFKYNVIMGFHNGLAAAYYEDKNGYLDTLGNVVVPFKYDGALDFKGGVAQVYVGDKCGFIDTKGREITPIKYELLYDFEDGMARVWIDGKYGFIDKSGKEVIPAQYEWASNFYEGKATVQLNEGEFRIDKNGKKVK